VSYFGSYFDPATPLYPAPATADPVPAVALAAMCCDEDVAILDPIGFANLAPGSQDLAAGTDGVFAEGERWTLTSATADFAAQGVAAGCVVALTKPQVSFRQPGGDLYGVAGVSGTSVALRKLGRASGVGQPPAPAAGLEGVEFRVVSFAPQVEDESTEVRRSYDLDDDARGLAKLMEAGEELRRLAALRVLRWAYTTTQALKDTDAEAKLGLWTTGLKDLTARLQLRWGDRDAPTAPPTGSPFGTTEGPLMGTLALEDCGPVKCWDLTRDRLRDDAGLAAARITLEFFGDNARGVTSLANSRTPAVRFYPNLGNSIGWANEGEMRMPLVVGVEACLAAQDPRDGMNLMAAIMRALYPAGDDGSAFQQALIGQGATTGLWQFPRPLATWDRPRDGLFRVFGGLSLEVNSDVLTV
jgi:hypothetical protein